MSITKKTLFFTAAASLLSINVAMAGVYDKYDTDPEATAEQAQQQVVQPVEHELKGQAPILTTLVTSGQGTANASYTSPNAFGSGYSAFINFNRISYWTGTAVDGGAMTVGGSFGDPHRYVGATMALNVTSMSLDGNFMRNGSGTVRINRYLNDTTALALGVGNVYGWGEFNKSAHSYYAAMTHTFQLSMPLTVNAGIGTGAFNGPTDFSADRDSNFMPFFGASLGVLYNLSVLADYTSKEFSLGTDYAFRLFNIPFVANAGIVNILSNNGGNTDFQCGIGAAYLFKA